MEVYLHPPPPYAFVAWCFIKHRYDMTKQCALVTHRELWSRVDVHRAVHRNIILIVKPTRCTNVSNLFIFWNDTVHVSDGFSVHHHEFKTVHTATGICQTCTAVCLLAGTRWNCGADVSGPCG